MPDVALSSGQVWLPVKDGDPRLIFLFRRHYSCKNKRGNHTRYGMSGKGESLCLITPDCNAGWCWRLVVTEGVVCSFFRNYGCPIQSSELIREADEIAWRRWPDYPRHYTYVDAEKTARRRSKNAPAGKCFLHAGWRALPDLSKGGLVILEKLP